MTAEPETPQRSRASQAAVCSRTALLAASASAQTFTDPNLSVTTVVNGTLATPTAMAFVGPDDFLVLEKAGTVRRVKNGVLQPTPALTVAVNASGEHGLLGIAVNSETPRKVFLYYTEVRSRTARRWATASIATPGTPPRACSRARS